MRTPVILAAVALAASATSSARADGIPFTIQWDNLPISLPSQHHRGAIQFTSPGAMTGGNFSAILNAVWNGPVQGAGSFDNLNNAAYSLTLRITDLASGASGTVPITGILRAFRLSALGAAPGSNRFTSPATQHLHLGVHDYTIGSLGFTAPVGHTPGSITGLVTAQGPAVAPEPSALLLGALGAAVAVGYRSRRRPPAFT
jgi:hypothetical protein